MSVSFTPTFPAPRKDLGPEWTHRAAGTHLAGCVLNSVRGTVCVDYDLTECLGRYANPKQYMATTLLLLGSVTVPDTLLCPSAAAQSTPTSGPWHHRHIRLDTPLLREVSGCGGVFSSTPAFTH